MEALRKRLQAPNGRDITLNTGLFIDNQFVCGSGEKIVSTNPANGEEIVQVEAASAQDVDKAVSAARQALNTAEWHDIAPAKRGVLLNKLADLVAEERETLAVLETWSNGKPYTVARDEDLAEVESTLRYYAGWADKLSGRTAYKAGYEQKKLGYTIRQPIGVCALVIPWNYPLGMASWKLGPALACGNTVVLKPAEQTPLSILFFAELVIRAGFPPGVVNIVNGTGRIAGSALVSHKDIDKLAFTGSTATGRDVMRAASLNLTPVTLETGGKSPLIIFEDADLEQAAKWSHLGIMSNQGQICTATSRIIVHRSVHDHFIRLFQKCIEDLSVVGDPFAEETTQGPQVSRDQYTKILQFIERAKSEGSELITGGEQFLSSHTKRTGFYIQPTVFSNVKPETELFQEEVFGPVAAITVFDTLDEAIKIANNSQYGLGAAVFTSDVTTSHVVAERLEAGMVWINSSQDGDVRIPFGGVKQSGIGRELGEAGLAAYTQEKSVHVNLGLTL